MSRKSDSEEFVRLWLETKKSNGTMDDLGYKLGISRQAVQFRATRLKSWGVNLPPLKNNIANPYDVVYLNKLIADEDV